MYSSLPKEWEKVSLSSVASRIKTRNIVLNNNVLTISAKDGLVNQKEYFNKYVASENLTNYFRLEKGDFAYNKSYSIGYPVGVVRRLKKYAEGVLSPLYICFRIDSNHVDNTYAEYYFDDFWFIEEINQIAKEGIRNHGLLNVGVHDFFDIQFILPTLTEQKKIAAILSSADHAIESVKAQIAKLKDLKTAMMQDLFAKGIGQTEFQDSPVGKIPLTWNVLKLAELVKTEKAITYGIVQTGEHIHNGIPCVRVMDLVKDNLSTANMIRTSAEISEKFKRTILSINDIMFALRGEIGHVQLVGANLVGANLTRGIALISANKKIGSDFLLWAIRSTYVRKNILDRVNGSALQEIPLSNLRDVDIPVPPRHEQIKIVTLLNAIENRLNIHVSKLSVVEKLKKALMQDLLTGKVRVSVN